VLDDPRERHPERVRRVLFVTGKAAIDLLDHEAASSARDEVAVVRLELLYPFPGRDIGHILERYSNATEIVWLQEEPANMGAWTYVEPRLRELLGPDRSVRYVGRPEKASTAEGSATNHAREQSRIVAEAFRLGERSTEKAERGVQHVR
jgi:2-oxoglutarate dehydrogenase E1 component